MHFSLVTWSKIEHNASLCIFIVFISFGENNAFCNGKGALCFFLDRTKELFCFSSYLNEF